MSGKKNYVGRTNRNGTKVTRATHDRLAPELIASHAERAVRRAHRWLKSNPGIGLEAAPRHIREKVGA